MPAYPSPHPNEDKPQLPCGLGGVAPMERGPWTLNWITTVARL